MRRWEIDQKLCRQSPGNRVEARRAGITTAAKFLEADVGSTAHDDDARRSILEALHNLFPHEHTVVNNELRLRKPVKSKLE
jgi:hypothetical protein